MNIRPFLLSVAVVSGWASTAFPAAARAEDTLTAIKARHTLIVGVRSDAAPYASFQGERYSGLEPDLARRLAHDILGDAAAVRFVAVTPGNRFQFLRNRKVDVLFATLDRTPELSKVLTISSPYARSGWTLLVRTNDRTINRPSDLKANMTVAAIAHTGAETGLDRLAPKARKIVFERVDQAATALKAGIIDAFAEDARIVTAIAKNDPALRTTPGKHDEADIVAACPKTDSTLCAYVTREVQHGARLGAARRGEAVLDREPRRNNAYLRP